MKALIDVKNIIQLKKLSYPQKESNTRDGDGYRKPRFRIKVPENVADAANSADVWMFFKILKIPAEFLNIPADTWNNNQCYLKGQHSADIKAHKSM